MRIAGIGIVAVLAGFGLLSGSHAEAPQPAAAFTADGRLAYPTDYREWVFLSCGFDMSYAEGAAPAEGRHVFDNVFVDRAAFAAFLRTGRWPEGAVFVLEVRRASATGSINRGGQFQAERAALEAHVKDRRFPSGWAFFTFPGEAPAAPLPQTSGCNRCHEASGAVDTTFVQFYPTLLPLARARNTLSQAYLAQENTR